MTYGPVWQSQEMRSGVLERRGYQNPLPSLPALFLLQRARRCSVASGIACCSRRQNEAPAGDKTLHEFSQLLVAFVVHRTVLTAGDFLTSAKTCARHRREKLPFLSVNRPRKPSTNEEALEVVNHLFVFGMVIFRIAKTLFL